MSTRAQIRFATREEGVSFSEHPSVIHAQFYCHYDGYPEYLGCKLAEFLCDFRVVNGLPTNYFENIKVANGMGCLTAQLIAGLKEEPGNVYIEDKDRPHGWLDYEYYVWGHTGKDIWISIFDGDECIFVGKPKQLQNKYGE